MVELQELGEDHEAQEAASSMAISAGALAMIWHDSIWERGCAFVNDGLENIATIPANP